MSFAHISLDEISSEFLQLCVAVGQHAGKCRAHYLDYEIIPPEIRAVGEAQAVEPLSKLDDCARRLRDRLSSVDCSVPDECERREFLFGQLTAVLRQIANTREQKIGDELDGLLPKGGSINERHKKWREAFRIPKDALQTVFVCAIEEARSITRKHVVGFPTVEEYELRLDLR